MGKIVLNLPLRLDPEEIYPYLGIVRSDPSDLIRELIDMYLKKIRHLAKPQGIWETWNVRAVSSKIIQLEGAPLMIEGPLTTAHFAGCPRISLLAATLGPGVVSFLEELSSSKPGHALIFDAVASAAAENLTEQLDSLIGREIRRSGYYPTARFSPGYGDWPLTWQQSLLDSLGADRIQLSANPYSLLIPVKSVTAAIGWSNFPVERNYDPPSPRKPCQGTLKCRHCPLAPHCEHFSGSTDQSG